MFCEYCGKQLEEGWKSCPYCGGESKVYKKNESIKQTVTVEDDITTSSRIKKEMKYTKEIQNALESTNAYSFRKKVQENGGNILDSQVSVSVIEKIFIGISLFLGIISIRGWNILPCVIIIGLAYGCASLYSNKRGKIKNFMSLWSDHDDIIDCSRIIFELSEQEIELLEEIRKKKVEQFSTIIIGFIIVFFCWGSFGLIVSVIATLLYIIGLFSAGSELKEAEKNWNYYFLARSAQEDIKNSD